MGLLSYLEYKREEGIGKRKEGIGKSY